jgi:hypothetical protein
MEKQRMSRFVRVLAAGLALSALSTAFAGAASAGVSKSAGGGAAKIKRFDVPTSVDCGGKTSTTVTVSYAVSKATKQKLVVDGRALGGTGKSQASVDAPVHCDPLPHTFVLAAYDSAGKRTTEQKVLTTNP